MRLLLWILNTFVEKKSNPRSQWEMQMLGISKQTKHNENNNKLTHKAKQTKKHHFFLQLLFL